MLQTNSNNDDHVHTDTPAAMDDVQLVEIGAPSSSDDSAPSGGGGVAHCNRCADCVSVVGLLVALGALVVLLMLVSTMLITQHVECRAIPMFVAGVTSRTDPAVCTNGTLYTALQLSVSGTALESICTYDVHQCSALQYALGDRVDVFVCTNDVMADETTCTREDTSRAIPPPIGRIMGACALLLIVGFVVFVVCGALWLSLKECIVRACTPTAPP